MTDSITKSEETMIKTIFNNYSMSGSEKKLRLWTQEMIDTVNAIVYNHTARVKTKVVEKVIYVDKQKSEQEQRDLLSKIVRGK